MWQLLLLPCFYLLAYGGGYLVAKRRSPRGLLGQVLVTLVVGSAQLVFTMQVLSLFHWLRPDALLAFNALLTAAVYFGLPRSALQTGTQAAFSWRTLSSRATLFIRENPIAALMLFSVLGIIVGTVALGGRVLPMTDTYHFSAPLYWKEYASMLPYATANPRHVCLTMGSEALCFPGLLYARSFIMYPILTGLGAVLCLWIVAHLALWLGASPGSAVCAGSVALGYLPLSGPLFGPSPDMHMVGVFFGASLFFLVEASRREEEWAECFGLAVLSFLMGCGVKNVVSIQAPIFILAATLLLGRKLLGWRALKAAVLAGFLGVACSTLAWNYASNLLWYGHLQGDVVLRETVAHDFHPAAVWTRFARGMVTLAIDPVWLPSSLKEPYRIFAARAVRLVGGSEFLAEDNQDYYYFQGNPGFGLGWLGTAVFIPGLIVGLAAWARAKRGGAWQPPAVHAGWLAVLTIGSLFLSCAALRWQSIGLARLMVTGLILGAPLGALLLRRRWAQAAVAVVLLGVLAVHVVFCAAMAVRRLGLSNRGLVAKLSALHQDRTTPLVYTWHGEAPVAWQIRQNWTSREYYELLDTRLPSFSTCGLVAGYNSEDIFAFGADRTNRVYSLIDCRAPTVLQAPPADVNYIVLDGIAPYESAASHFPGFSPWLSVTQEDQTTFAVLQRDPAAGPKHPEKSSP